MRRIFLLGFAFLFACFLFASPAARGDSDTAIFETTMPPDVLLALDCSGSMVWDPAGNTCPTAPTIPPIPPPCSRIDIAKEAIRMLLDDNGDGKIDDKDYQSLRVRIGFMRFYGCYTDENSDYNAGCNVLRNALGTSYSTIYSTVQSEAPSGGTPLGGLLGEAKLYLDDHKKTDSAAACRQKFVILITDGSDTFSCGALGYECGDSGPTGYSHRYQGRREVVARAKALRDAGYKVFIVGFGANMPNYLKYTLNWAAYYGGSDNPTETNTGDPAAYDPANTTSCQLESDTDLITGTCRESGVDYSMSFFAPQNDPGNTELTGYAFLATSATELQAALKQAMSMIQEATYSFSTGSVTATRALDENYVYAPSFIPRDQEPFWPGFLKRYGINGDGTLNASYDWDAGANLKNRTAASRLIYTAKGGALKTFLATGSDPITPAELGLWPDKTTDRNKIVGYIRGESTYNKDDWKLGDIFHSNPVTVGRPSLYYNDPLSPQAFIDFRNSKWTRERLVFVAANDGQLHAFKAGDGGENWSFISPNLLPKLRLIAHSSHPTGLVHQYFNDGPLTAADVWLGSGTGTSKSSGDWRTLLIVGLGKGVRDASNDATYLWSSCPTCDGDAQFFKEHWSSSFPYYCGFYALDVTDTGAAQPTLKWFVNPNSTQAKYLAEAWSKMAVGRVLIDGDERWVGFFGGGYNSQGDDEYDDSFDMGDKGKGFFVVDLKSGTLLWSYTKADNGTLYHSIPAPPTAVDTDNDGLVDTVYIGDLGGNIFRVKFCTYYDEYDAVQGGGHCGISDWKGGLFFHGENIEESHKPIFTAPSVARDSDLRLWVFWGTGNRVNPTYTTLYHGTTEKFWGVIDSDRTSHYHLSDLKDLTSGGIFTYDGTKKGWYIKLTGTGEKVLADPVVFGGVAIFSTYTPAPYSGSDICGSAGTAKLYAVAMMPLVINGVTYNPGAGLLSEPADKSSTAGGNRSMVIGAGIATAPVISQQWAGGTSSKPTSSDLFLTVSGGAGTNTVMVTSGEFQDSPLVKKLKSTVPSGQFLHWRDQRVQ